jgi:hypothetical protein
MGTRESVFGYRRRTRWTEAGKGIAARKKFKESKEFEEFKEAVLRFSTDEQLGSRFFWLHFACNLR